MLADDSSCFMMTDPRSMSAEKKKTSKSVSMFSVYAMFLRKKSKQSEKIGREGKRTIEIYGTKRNIMHLSMLYRGEGGGRGWVEILIRHSCPREWLLTL